jgi:hypothetical protein
MVNKLLATLEANRVFNKTCNSIVMEELVTLLSSIVTNQEIFKVMNYDRELWIMINLLKLNLNLILGSKEMEDCISKFIFIKLF